jgi:hypothetical protein
MLDMLISGMADGKPPSQILALGTKPRGVDEIEASIRRELAPNEVKGYRAISGAAPAASKPVAPSATAKGSTPPWMK